MSEQTKAEQSKSGFQLLVLPDLPRELWTLNEPVHRSDSRERLMRLAAHLNECRKPAGKHWIVREAQSEWRYELAPTPDVEELG